MAQGQASAHDPSISPEQVVHLSQNRLLPLLLQKVGDADVRFGHSVDGAVQRSGGSGGGGVTVSGRRCADGAAFEVECDYLVAADGANSRIRCVLLGYKVETFMAQFWGSGHSISVLVL